MTDLVFTKENIFLNNNNFNDKNDLFNFISTESFKLNYVKSQEECLKGLQEREELQTTGFQDGFAIPHCKNNTVLEPKILFVQSNPIPWNSLDGSDITSSFVLLIPENGSKNHLKLLALLAKSLIDKEYRTKLKSSDNIDQIYTLVSQKLEV